MAENVPPLNGTKTHPLSKHAVYALRRLANEGPTPRQEFNPGVVNRLVREDLAKMEQRPSPYRTVRGNVSFLVLTNSGKQGIVDADAKGR